MIAEKLVVFLHGAIPSFIGTRDSFLRPTVTWALGLRVSAATDEITALIPDVEIERTRRNVEQNGLVALTASHVLSHEAYQFKGKAIELRPSTEEERAVQEIYRAKLISTASMFPRELFAGYTLYPSTALTFRVEQIFVQTPGPQAGKVLELSAEARS